MESIMTKYHYNRGGTGRAACNKNLVLANSRRLGWRCLSAKAIREQRFVNSNLCAHCVRIVMKESGG